MQFASTRIIADDIHGLVGFYERVTGTDAVWVFPDQFAEIRLGGFTLAIGSTATVPMFSPGSAEAGANRTAILEFLVDDVDAEYARLRESVTDVVTEPTTMPWGNRSLLFRDPEGTLVNLFAPVTDAARVKFGV